MRLPIFQGVRGIPAPFHPEIINQTSKKQPPSPSASSAVHTEIKTMSSVSANMVLISVVRPCAPTLHGGSTQKPERRGRDGEETSRERPSRSTTTLTARNLHFRFRGTEPELHLSFSPCGHLSRKTAATRKSRGLKARTRPSLARVGDAVSSEDGGVVEGSPPPRCVNCSPSPIAYLNTRTLPCGICTSPPAPLLWPKS